MQIQILSTVCQNVCAQTRRDHYRTSHNASGIASQEELCDVWIVFLFFVHFEGTHYFVEKDIVV